MRVAELAKDLKVGATDLIHLLRTMGIRVTNARAPLGEADVARVLARLEKERRSGHKGAEEALAAALEGAQSTTRRRRRRRKADLPPEPEVAPEADDDAEVETEEGEVASAEPVAEAVPEPEPAEEAAAVPVEDDAPAVESPEPATADASDGTVESEPAEPVAEPPSAEPSEAVAVDTAAKEDDTATASPPGPTPVDEGMPPPKPPRPAREGAPTGPRRVLDPAAARRRRSASPPPAASAGPGGRVRIQAEGYTPDGRRKDRERKKGKKKQRVDRDAVQTNVQRVMAELQGGGKKRRKGRARQQAMKEEREQQAEQARQEQEQEARTIRVTEFLTISELAELMDVPSTEIVGAAFKNLGLMVTVNQRLDFDQIELLLEEFGFEAAREEEYVGVVDEAEEDTDPPESLRPRPPVVTVMGHVDHGKTRLLDAVRDTNVVAGEAGGITQHIGAYHVELDEERTITFLDTPGHAAFTAMRARGADVTDIVILVIAADDSVMPQTVEAISHAKNAGVPLVVAVNKVDLPASDPARVKQELLQHGVTVEEFGGDVLAADVSAKQGQGIDDLLEKVLLQAEILELQANPDREAVGTVIEAQLDVGKGPVATILVQRGTLRVGDDFIVGLYDGRVRAMLDERGNAVEEAGPGIPVQVLGTPGVPQAGDVLQVMEANRAAEIAQTRQRLEREKRHRIQRRGMRLGDFSDLLAEGEVSTLPLIIKGDVDGSVQAVADALEQLSTTEVGVDVIHRAVGAINESDVLLAQTSGAVIVGFRVRPDTGARQLAERENVDIHTYDIIYEAVEEVKSALEGMLAPAKKEHVVGSAEVRATFKVTKVGTIAGCYVTDGLIQRGSKVRLIRNGIVVYDGELSSLKRFKDDVKEVREGFECGMGIANYNDVKVGDIIEAYTVEEVARTLADV